jgi:predicted esterase
MPVTVNDGAQMPSWFDMDEIPVSKSTVDHAASFHDSIKFVHGLIDKQVAAGIPAERIVLGGFSQGAALSLAAGLRYPHKLAAIIMVSGWAALQSEYPGCIVPENAKTPVWAMHGDEDTVVLTENLSNVKQLLEGLSVPVKTTLFEGAHQLPEDFHLAAYLDEVVPG